jgi:hypothetical protein
MRGRLTAGILVGLVGLVWIGQGLGIIRNQSFMVDDIRWSVIGVAMVAIGGGLAFSAWRSIRTRP